MAGANKVSTSSSPNSLILTILSWNLEGFSRNSFNLAEIARIEKPSLIFLSEPWLHLSDAQIALEHLSHQYCSYLNSEDRHDDLLSLRMSRAHGGTFALWDKTLDPYITILEPVTSRILVMILDKPGYQISIHITIYLTTAGKDSQYMEDLSTLELTIDELSEKYPDSVLYIRGDANSSPVPRKLNKRDVLFKHFLETNNLNYVPTDNNTYHHFTNEGRSDSTIDVLLCSQFTSEGFPNDCQEQLLSILCGKTNSLIDSTHDALLSTVSFPPISHPTPSLGNTSAPRIPNTKHKIIWSDEGITAYQELLENTLPALQYDSADELLASSASVLFEMTNHILTSAAKNTNESVEMSSSTKSRKPPTPPEIKASMKSKDIAHHHLLSVSKDPSSSDSAKQSAQEKFKSEKRLNQKLVRDYNVGKECLSHSELNNLLTSNPDKVFQAIKSQKSKESKIKSLQVNDKVYTEDSIPDGFFDGIKELKTIKTITASSFDTFAEDHRHIVEICKYGQKIPKISQDGALTLLKRIRPEVSDFFSISAAHYLNGGEAALLHFKFLVNTVLANIEIAAIDALNTAHAVILHKGHGKDKSLASSYRTISSCPFISKAIDIYLGDLSRDDWQQCQAETQFQGDNMSHELASLLLTITIQHCLSNNKPIFVLLLDAKSAFDLVLKEILVRRLYLDTTPDQRIRYWDLRLENRTTFCQWDGQLMGPISDQRGVEQGGPNSSDFYKIL